MKKSIYGLPDLAQLMRAGVQRYSQWLARLAQHTAGHRDIERSGCPERDAHGRSYCGFNLFWEEDERVLERVPRRRTGIVSSLTSPPGRVICAR